MVHDATLLSADQLSWSHQDKAIVAQVSLSLQAGEVLGIIGPNGAGKSSLLRLLSRLQRPDQGQCNLLGRPFADWDESRFAQTLAYQEQGATVHWPLSVRRVVSLGRLPWLGPFASPSAADDAAIAAALATCGLTRLAEHRVDQLSAGEEALVSLARLLAGEPQVLIADEPAAALDLHHQLLLMETLQRLTRGHEGRGALVVLHDLNLAARYCDRLLLMHEGRIVAAGEPTSVLSADNLRRYYQVEAAIIASAQGPIIAPMQRLKP